MTNQKKAGGNTMPAITRRLSLLAGSSLVAASLATAGSAVVVLAPGQAAAQAVCVPAPTTGGGTNSVSYGGALYSSGIDCDANGDMTVAVTSNGVDVGATGIDLDASGVDDITFSSTIEIDGNGLTGALVNATTASGTITINAQNLDADQTAATNMTHGVLATSASGDIVMNITGNIDAEASGNNPGGVAAIEARTGGTGNIDITAGNMQGRLYGILAATSGTGDLTLNLANNIDAQQGMAIDVTTGSGDFVLNMASGEIRGQGSAGGLRGDFGGDATLTFDAVRLFNPGGWALDLENTGGTLTTVNSNAMLLSSNSTATAYTANMLRGAGAGDYALNFGATVSIAGNTGQYHGLVDFTGATGDVDLNILAGSTWRFESESRFGAGDDTLAIAAGGMVHGVRAGHTIAFGDGDDRLANNGFLVVGGALYNPLSPVLVDTRLTGLEVFNNAGTIILGGPQTSNSYNAPEAAARGTDGTPRAILSMPGTTFTGSGDSLILMDVNLNNSQTACDPALRDANGFMPAADCLAIQGGATAGVTRVLVNDMVPGDRGAYDETGIVLVDVSGGTGATGDFIIDPASPGYSAAMGGVIDKGFYFYPLIFDPDTQQHKLVSVVGQNALQFPLLAGAVQSLWRTSTGVWFDRQADIRSGFNAGLGGGIWLRATGENAERTVIQPVEGAGSTFTFDNSFEQQSYAVTGGLDLLSASSQDSAFVLGFMAGYAHSDIEYETSPNVGRLDGWSAGLYGSYLAGGLFVDAAVNANKLTLDDDVPGLNLFPAGTILSTDLVSVGVQVEAGWRFPITRTAFVEPLAAVSYLRSSIEDVQVPADDPTRERIFVIYDDPTSLRGSLGARLGLDQDYGAVRMQYSLLGRVWEEFEDGYAVTFQGPGDDAFASDPFTGQISEVSLGAAIYGADGIVSGFVNLGGKFGDDYEAKTASLGVRVSW